MNIILVNATASHSSGALSIYKDFINFIKSYDDDTKFYYVFTSVKEFSDSEFIKFIYMDKMNWRKRIEWDEHGLEKWCIEHKIFPDLVVSFQNTCSKFHLERLVEIPQLVYFHQMLPLTPYRWSIWKREEFKLFLYTHFYGFFINQNNKNATYVVQLKYIKERFLQKFSNVPDQKVHVIRPNLPLVNVESIIPVSLENGIYHFIYPATALRYKNHKVILQALQYLRKTNMTLLSNIKVYFTVSKSSPVYEMTKKLNLLNTVYFMGSIPYENLLRHYKSCTGVLFPSEIESFGLPLVEAALFGKRIIAADLPYAREVLDSYEGVEFATSNDFVEWTKKIENCCTFSSSVLPMKQSKKNSWQNFISLINQLLN